MTQDAFYFLRYLLRLKHPAVRLELVELYGVGPAELLLVVFPLRRESVL